MDTIKAIISLTVANAVTPVIKELPHWAGGARPPRLLPVDRVQRLVHEQAEAAKESYPARRLDMFKN
jgi:hypothetical protein